MKKATSLRSLMVGLFALSILSTGLIMSALVLFVSVPSMEETRRQFVSHSAVELAERTESVLSGVEQRLALLAEFHDTLSTSTLDALLERTVGSSAEFNAIYIIDGQGRIKSAHVDRDIGALPENLVNSDMSGNLLYRQALKRTGVTWSDKYLSVFLGVSTIGVAFAKGDAVVMAELRAEYIARMIHLAVNDPRLRVLVADRRGEIVVDSEEAHNHNIENLGGDSAFRSILQQNSNTDVLSFRGVQYVAARSKSDPLGWSFLALTPTGMDDKELRNLVYGALVILGGSLLIGLIFAPFWASQIVLAVKELMKHARAVIEGDSSMSWPQGRIHELNQLSDDLERMASTLKDREQQQLAIFEVSPVAMLVVELANNIIIETNSALESLFQYARHDIVGLSYMAFFGTVGDADGADADILMRVQDGDWQEVSLCRRDGVSIRCIVGSRTVSLHDKELRLYVLTDITQRSNLERELKELNAALEQRVAQRTEALSLSNTELTSALANLQQAQTELVRAEKLAALGSVVAGVAHELNTPVGNGMLAASTLNEYVVDFQKKVERGLKRSELNEFVEEVGNAATIVLRNLDRAGHLVASFKQVSVDQTSSLRREFDLHDLIDDILVTTRPMLKKTPYKLESEVASGIRMDTFAGPLEQVLINLINNAILHGFDGREHGRITISASHDEENRVRLVVADDGKGIHPDIRDRIFDPFVTTKMGHGGSGLGLHIVHNIVTHVLGGEVYVETPAEQGTGFVLILPVEAPKLAIKDSSDQV